MNPFRVVKPCLLETRLNVSRLSFPKDSKLDFPFSVFYSAGFVVIDGLIDDSVKYNISRREFYTFYART